MKRLIFLLVSVMMLSVTTFIVPAGQASAAGLPSLEGLTYDELVALRDQINLAIWNSQEWQEVTVPDGVWKVGEDIPAGHWTIGIASEDDYLDVSYFDNIDPKSKSPRDCTVYYSQDLATPNRSAKTIYRETIDIELEEGWYFKCTGAVVFMPYSGKPDLGFK